MNLIVKIDNEMKEKGKFYGTKELGDAGNILKINTDLIRTTKEPFLEFSNVITHELYHVTFDKVNMNNISEETIVIICSMKHNSISKARDEIFDFVIRARHNDQFVIDYM